MVFDLGHHDVSILELGDGVFEVTETPTSAATTSTKPSSSGSWTIQNENSGLDLSKDPMALQRGRAAEGEDW